MYHTEGPAKRALTNTRKLAERWKRQGVNLDYVQRIYDFLEKAEIVKIRIDISVEE